MTFPKSIRDQSGMVPGSPVHEKTSIWMHWKLPELSRTSKNDKSDKLKNWQRKWRDRRVRSWFRFLLSSFGLFSLFFWLNMTLRADRLKSNYLGCWILPSTRPRSSENKSQKSFKFWIYISFFWKIQSVEKSKSSSNRSNTMKSMIYPRLRKF